MTGFVKILTVLASTVVLVFLAQAAFMHGMLTADAAGRGFSLHGAYPYLALYLAFLILVLAGALPALLLTRLRMETLGNYVLFGLLSGLLTTYCVVNSWGTAENAGAILHHISTPAGWRYEAPSFLEMFVDQFRWAGSLILEIPDDLRHLPYSARVLGPVFMCIFFVPTPFGAALGAMYWRTFVRRAAKRGISD